MVRFVIYVYDVPTGGLIAEFESLEEFRNSRFNDENLDGISNIGAQIHTPISEFTEATQDMMLLDYLTHLKK